MSQSGLHVILVGSHGGVSNALDGGSAHALEDLAYMRALPNMTVLFPGDANQMKQAVKAALLHRGPIYLRLYREATPVFTDPDRAFEIGKAYVEREGSDVSIIAIGPQVAFALEAAQQLEKDGIQAEIVNVHTIQPIDVETIASSAAKTQKVLTVEDHSVNGGLGSAVAEALSESVPTPLRRIGLRQFGESGTYADLTKKLGIDAEGIYRNTKNFLEGMDDVKGWYKSFGDRT